MSLKAVFVFTKDVLFLILLCGGGILCVDNVKIKIVEAPALSNFPSFQSASSKKLFLRNDPSPLSGPLHLQQLNGECFVGKEKGYEYHVCPFQNVTQKEEKIGWNSFHGVLGVWHEWIIENDTLKGMHFTMGERCGYVDREAKVMLNCSTRTKVYNVSEPSSCNYRIWLDTPLACFKGAMQVYHLLNDRQLNTWSSFDEEYFRDEITFQGLTKQRRKLLTEAGLLAPPEKIAETKPKEEVVLQSPQTMVTNGLSECKQDKEKIEKTLKELQSKVEQLIQHYPTVASSLGFVSNNQSKAVNSTTAHTDRVTEGTYATGVHVHNNNRTGYNQPRTTIGSNATVVGDEIVKDSVRK